MPRKYKRKDGNISVYEKPSGKPRGRPNTFTKDKRDWAISLAKRSKSYKSIADEMKVTDGTFWRWLRAFPDFRRELDEVLSIPMIEKAKACLELRLEAYKYKEEKVTEVIDPETEIVQSRRKEVSRKVLPPDVAAAKALLDYYAKRKEREEASEDTLDAPAMQSITIDPSKLTKEQLKAIKQALIDVPQD